MFLCSLIVRHGLNWMVMKTRLGEGERKKRKKKKQVRRLDSVAAIEVKKLKLDQM